MKKCPNKIWAIGIIAFFALCIWSMIDMADNPDYLRYYAPNLFTPM